MCRRRRSTRPPGGARWQVVFDNVTASGVTSLMTGATAPPLPAGFVVGDPPTYFDHLDHCGLRRRCRRSASASPGSPTSIRRTLRLYHYEGNPGAWVDATTSVDTGAEIICGSVTSLSPFALVQPAPSVHVRGGDDRSPREQTAHSPCEPMRFLHPTLSRERRRPRRHRPRRSPRRHGRAPRRGGTRLGRRSHAIMLTGREAGVEVTQSFSADRSVRLRPSPSPRDRSSSRSASAGRSR